MAKADLLGFTLAAAKEYLDAGGHLYAVRETAPPLGIRADSLAERYVARLTIGGEGILQLLLCAKTRKETFYGPPGEAACTLK
jgi:hypothetical protein